MMKTLEETREWVELLKGQRTALELGIKEEKSNLKRATQRSQDIEQAQEIVQIVSQAIQQEAHDRLTRIVSKCLQSVFFDEDYGFKIRFDRKRGKTEACIIITNSGHDVEDPMEAEGGGVKDVAAFVLQVSCMLLSKPRVRPLLVLDEPFKWVSIEYRDRVRKMIEMLAQDFDVQFIIVTHIDELTTGKVVRL